MLEAACLLITSPAQESAEAAPHTRCLACQEPRDVPGCGCGTKVNRVAPLLGFCSWAALGEGRWHLNVWLWWSPRFHPHGAGRGPETSPCLGWGLEIKSNMFRKKLCVYTCVKFCVYKGWCHPVICMARGSAELAVPLLFLLLQWGGGKTLDVWWQNLRAQALCGEGTLISVSGVLSAKCSGEHWIKAVWCGDTEL